jgi:hypothetical protein
LQPDPLTGDGTVHLAGLPAGGTGLEVVFVLDELVDEGVVDGEVEGFFEERGPVDVDVVAVDLLALLLHAEEDEEVFFGPGGEDLGLDLLQVVDDDAVEVVPAVLDEVV